MTIETDRQKLRDYFPRCGWPALYYGVVSELARSIDAKSIVEVGVAYGYHAQRLLTDLPTCAYHGVDPYRADYDSEDPFAGDVAVLFSETSRQTALDRLYAAVQAEMLASFGERAMLRRVPSSIGASSFAAGTADLIFIDGDHRYEAVRDDLAAWWPALREGGIFCGDDYLWPDVKKAVDAFAGGVGHERRLVGKAGTNYPIWMIRK